MESERKPISKKIRFEVFKRDNFTCQYCGKTPPQTTLEVDHIQPVSKGGTDDINNLTTSCFDCNRGKSNIELKTIQNTLIENYEIIKEREEQLKEYHKLIRKIEKRKDTEVGMVENKFIEYFEDYTLKQEFKNGTIKLFLNHLDVYVVVEAMEIACSRKKDPTFAIKYFCGICWNKIKGVKPRWEE